MKLRCQNNSKMTRLKAFLIFLMGCFALCETSLAAVEILPGKGIANLQNHLTYYSEPQERLSGALQKFKDGAFEADLKTSLLDTNYAPEAWGAVEVINATLDDGRAPDPFVVTLSIALASAVDIFVIRDNGFTESLLNYYAFDPFVPEDHSVTRLRTPVFEIAPQETLTILINFKFGPFQDFHLSLETPQQLEAAAFASGISNTAFYAFCASCLLFFVGFHLAMKNWMGFYYALLFAVGLSQIAYIDGLWFRFLYPGTPQWQSVTGFFHLFALSGVGFLASGASMAGVADRPGLTRLLMSLAALSLAGFVVSLVSPGTYVAFFGYLLLVAMFVALFIVGRQWRRNDGNFHLSSVLISGFATVAILVILVIIVLGSAADTLQAVVLIKGVYAVLLFATMSGLTAHIINLRRDHARAVHQRMHALEVEAERSQELLVSERNYTRAREVANLRQKQLAAASHDLKQPLASLRMTFDSLADQTQPHVRARLHEAFDYMEALSNDYLSDSSPESSGNQDVSALQHPHEASERPEAYEVSLIVNTVHQMFLEEAVSKGLRLRNVACSREIEVPAIVVMRIISNLVSNAVKYTRSGGVLIGARRGPAHVKLCVIDTGEGMTDQELERFRQAYQKGDTSEGHGLGLAVCFDLAAQNGMALTVASCKQRGTSFGLSIPLRQSGKGSAGH